MRFTDIFRKKSFEEKEKSIKHNQETCIPTVLDSASKQETKVNLQPELSLLELGAVNWTEFGAMLKQEQLLPPSYDKTPTKVTFGLSKANTPTVEIVFSSKTTPSFRTFKIYGNNIHEFVNGSNGANTRAEIISVWRRFKDRIVYRLNRDKNNEIHQIKNQDIELKLDAENIIKIEDLFQAEQIFMQQHKDDVYDFFGYMWDEERELPFFILPKTSNCADVFVADKITPFSPKTLEFCVLRLTDLEKYYNAEDQESLDSFIQKCNNLASKSIYKTERWAKTVDILVDMLKKHAEEYKKQHPEILEDEKE